MFRHECEIKDFFNADLANEADEDGSISYPFYLPDLPDPRSKIAGPDRIQ